MVTHIDEIAVRALSAFYRATLPRDGMVLDLMSSWVSHLPKDVAYAEVIGHGMNLEELQANLRLTRRFVQDLNRDWALPLEGSSCDAALCCVGVQYLQHLVEVFADVLRVLRPGAPFIGELLQPLLPDQGRRDLGARWAQRATPSSFGSIWSGRGSPTSRSPNSKAARRATP